MKPKRILCIALIIISFMFLCSFEETDDFFRYEIDDNDNAIIIAFTGEMFSEYVTIPSEINGHSVVKIAESAFYSHPHIRKVTIPSSVTLIDNAAFGYCPELVEVIIEDGENQLNIGWAAFENCTMLSKVQFGTRPIHIDDMAFENCIRLGIVDINENIIHFGYRAFGGCESLVFNITNNPLAEEHAKENFIPTSFLQTDRFKIIIGLGVSVFVLLTIFITYKIIRRKKVNMSN